jgi:glycosyltransferase involved in cell wall biosynthesis
MRVLFVTTNWPTEASPVDGTFVREHALAAATRCEVAVVHLQREAGRSGLYEIAPLAEPLRALRVRYRRHGRPLSYIAFAAGTAAALRRLRREGFEPDVLHASSFLSAAAALGPARMLRKPLVYTEHWTIFIPENPGRLSPLQRRIARLALRRSDIVLPVSEDLRAALARLAPRARFRVVPNAVDEGLFHPSDAPRPDGPVRLLAVGLMDGERKGFDLLLEAAARLRAVRDDFRLDMLGDGENRGTYESLSRGLGLDGVVTFHGLRPKAEVAEAMRRSDLFVLTSRYENNPCVAIEALASGVPVVATRVGGVPEVVPPDAGVLTEVDPERIAAAIGDALDRLGEFDRGSIASRAHERYGRDHVGSELAEVYDECVSRRSR